MHISTNYGPFISLPLIFFAVIFLNILYFNSAIYLMNSCLNWLLSNSFNLEKYVIYYFNIKNIFFFFYYCKSDSDSIGRIRVKQSLSLKKYFNYLLVLFFYSVLSDIPFCSSRAFSKYCFEEIVFSSLSTI